MEQAVGSAKQDGTKIKGKGARRAAARSWGTPNAAQSFTGSCPRSGFADKPGK